MKNFEAQATCAAKKAQEQSGHRVALDGVHSFGSLLSAARFRLDNGLTIVLMPDSRAPIFSFQSWFRVGSRNENPNRTGLAHLLEHLMFKGTHKHPAGVFDQSMERLGAQTNAATWVDWTYYYETLAVRPGNLETVIDFESDRMTGLVLDEDTFRSELEVVKNERRMSVDNTIPGLLSERLFAQAYQTHPYRWPTIGTMAHLDAVRLDDIQAFYATYYAPNNATLVLAGDVSLVEALTCIVARYGSIGAQPMEHRQLASEPVQEAARIEHIDRDVEAAQVIIGFHAPPQSSPDFVALEMLNDILVSGDSSRLYKRLVTELELAMDIEGCVSPFADPGLYEIMLTVRPGQDPLRTANIAMEELFQITKGIDAIEYDKARNNLELMRFASLGDAESCAEALGHFETNYGDFTMALTAVERIFEVTPSQLKTVAAQVFRPPNCTMIWAGR